MRKNLGREKGFWLGTSPVIAHDVDTISEGRRAAVGPAGTAVLRDVLVQSRGKVVLTSDVAPGAKSTRVKKERNNKTRVEMAGWMIISSATQYRRPHQSQT
jgi:hypothetical protein